jgi:hypothetical protein
MPEIRTERASNTDGINITGAIAENIRLGDQDSPLDVETIVVENIYDHDFSRDVPTCVKSTDRHSAAIYTDAD